MAKEIEAIERTILAAIVEGRIAPGAKLSENALASAFDVSRTMIREALARLEARKVLSVQARKGWFVNVPDAKEAAEVYSARRAVECGYLIYADPFTDAKSRASASISRTNARPSGRATRRCSPI